ncbi:MAG: PEPxxWA-CTERM sorting domain-containing protein [Sphingomonadaceae bacterium]|uniref:Npun_F0296 family exosortase-dependent surface protein n=1 Tax=Thermaurantiacus sp. TaxID=2820283 RepID=UPI00298EF24D|nr:PEPxxWA-CTERM sorting domain-containing protein [Thermaurantiacus sp.]MCS6986376.1 PEPxxWA-CTERM sorting domain-containing protein [Sphingomonadaceae bacterium]MDW8414362.1 PEPxxWA-CTERM sorting domain-containing protein [Thermaurantiacus sp.]
MLRPILAATAAALATAPALATVIVTIEAPGVQNSTATFDFNGVETFDARPLGVGQNFTTDFGGSEITGQYVNVQINAADQYGGADGTGQYAVAFPAEWGGGPYEILLSTTRPEGVNYFGYWLSALDAGNRVQFFKGADLVYQFNPADLLARVGGNRAYFCNPNAAFAGKNCGEPYAFVNFYFAEGKTIDRIRIFEDPAVGGYESDNHTVGYFTRIGGTPIPEPATWAMLIAGFGLVGMGLRRRRTAIA